MPKVLATLSLLLLLAACATRQVHYGFEKIDNLQPGVTTKQDLIKLFGMPTHALAARESYERWSWQYPPDMTAAGGGVYLFEVLLDPDGKLVRVMRVIRQ
jgi:hypothetical protein